MLKYEMDTLKYSESELADVKKWYLIDFTKNKCVYVAIQYFKLIKMQVFQKSSLWNCFTDEPPFLYNKNEIIFWQGSL